MSPTSSPVSVSSGCSAFERLRGRDDGGDRSPKLVRDIGHERAAHQIRSLEPRDVAQHSDHRARASRPEARPPIPARRSRRRAGSCAPGSVRRRARFRRPRRARGGAGGRRARARPGSSNRSFRRSARWPRAREASRPESRAPSGSFSNTSAVSRRSAWAFSAASASEVFILCTAAREELDLLSTRHRQVPRLTGRDRGRRFRQSRDRPREAARRRRPDQKQQKTDEEDGEARGPDVTAFDLPNRRLGRPRNEARRRRAGDGRSRTAAPARSPRNGATGPGRPGGPRALPADFRDSPSPARRRGADRCPPRHGRPRE